MELGTLKLAARKNQNAAGRKNCITFIDMSKESKPRLGRPKVAGSRSQPRMKSFNADPDVLEMLERAQNAGGVLSDIVNAALRQHGASAIKEIADELRKQADELEKSVSEGKH